MSDRDSMRELSAGIQLANRYTLIRKLGTGGAAEIWVASDRLTHASVALKILATDRLSADQLRQEWQTSIRLMHAHIVRVFEFHDDPGGAFYSLQYIDGVDMGALSSAPPNHVLAPVGLIADALRYAHGKGVVHCDVKASNVLLDQNGAPLLIDFGVASAGVPETGGGALIATSPQRLAGIAPQPADDIFALGGLIYELISGRSPYSSAATADDIRNAVPPPLQAADGSVVPAAVRQLVATMLDKDAEARPGAESVATGLEAAGFAPGPAPSHYVGRRQALTDEVIEAKAASRTANRHFVPASTLSNTSAEPGISRRVLGIGLLASFAALIGVVFFLPDTVSKNETSTLVTPDPGAAENAQEITQRQGVSFSENVDDLTGRDERVQARNRTEKVLGELLAKMETLEQRAVQRWAGLRYKQAEAVYAEGDEAYLARDYASAADKYREAIAIVEPLLDEVDDNFARSYSDAGAALQAADVSEALHLFELAVAISPSHAGARAGLGRARHLGTVLSLTDQGLTHERNLELEAARQSFASAIDIDPEWEAAQKGLQRVLAAMNQREFDQRMSEGLRALNDSDYHAARAAFRMAQALQPGSRDPVDGLLQVDQGIRLGRIAGLEQTAMSQEQEEQWTAAAETFASILELDGNLEFAQQGLARAETMGAVHKQLQGYIAEPDRLSVPSTMQAATSLVVDITRMPQIGPRLGDRRDQLSRLLKRAATPLTVQLVSDNATDVSIFKIGRLGSFATRELSLRPGTYVAVGSRPGFRDVRLEFRVAPETDDRTIVVRCEEAI